MNDQAPYNDNAMPATLAGVFVPVPPDFRDEEALKRLGRLAAELLSSGMPERELARRLTRYHPAQEGV